MEYVRNLSVDDFNLWMAHFIMQQEEADKLAKKRRGKR